MNGGQAAARGGRRFRLALLVWLCALALLRPLDPFGDHGLANVATGLGLLLAALLVLVRFLFRRALPLRRRLSGLGAVLLAAVLFLGSVRVVGVSGEMLPELAWRWKAARPAIVARARSERVALEPARASDYPAFLGARRDARVSGVELARDWSASPPRLRWRVPIGAGWSAFALVNGWGVTLEEDEQGERASARSLADGARAWSTRIDDGFAHTLGGAGPRATPAVDAGRVYALSAWGRLVCLEGASGELLWAHDLPSEHGRTRAEESARLQYGRANSPLVVQAADGAPLVVVPAGGDAGLVAFDARTGAPRWSSPAREPSYSSPVAATLAGVEQLLIVNEDTLSAHDPRDGRVLWEEPWPGQSSGAANVSQAVPLAPERVFVSKGYGCGARLLELAADAHGALAVRELWHDARLLRTKFTNVVVQAGCVYGLDDGMLECLELASGTRRWKEGRYGHGQILGVGELLLVCGEDGEVVLVAPDPQRANDVLGRFQALEGKCWANPAFCAGLLVLRNAEECAAWELPLAR